MNAPLAVEASDLERTYASGRTTVAALAGVTLGIRRGEFVAVMGPSGSGKSTLLNIVAGLERPTAGTVRVDGEDLAKLDEEALARHRNRRVGMVFQSFNLLPRFSVVDNVALPLAFSGVPAAERVRRSRAMLERLGMSARADHRSNELSGGELQRAAVAMLDEIKVGIPSHVSGDLNAAPHAAAQILHLALGHLR